MGVKNLHYQLRRFKVYKENVSVLKLLQTEGVTMTFVDVCCVFFGLFQKLIAEELLVLHFQKHFPLTRISKTENRTVEELLSVVVNEIIRRAQLLHASGTRVCLVIDGQRLRAKEHTDRYRQSKADRELDRARQHPQKHCFQKHAKAWILRGLNIPPYDATGSAKTSYFAAPFEADPQAVYLAETYPGRSCIFSNDSDLFCYLGALNSVRIMKIDNWDSPQLTGKIVASKAAFLDALGLRLLGENQYCSAELRLLLIAAYSGNDYAQNVPGKSFATIASYVRSYRKEIHSICALDSFIQENLGVMKSESRSSRFSVAICQFAAPSVNNTEGNRIIYNPLGYTTSEAIRELVDGLSS